MRTLLLLLILICSSAQAQKLTLAGYDVDVRIVPWSEAMEGTIKGDFYGLDALKAYRIGVIEGYAYSPDFQARDDLNRVPGESFTDNVRKVANGEIDLTLEDEIAGRFELINSAPELVRQVEFINPPLNQNPLHVAISRQNPDHEKIAADFNAAMAHFVKNEGIRSIQKMHGL